MLMPARVKYRKQQRGRRKGLSKGAKQLDFGEFGLQAVESAWVKANQIEAARVAITRYLKKSGKLWIRIFPDKPVTKKPAETRMGKGKGNPEYWVAVVKRFRIIFELTGVDEETAKIALKLGASKLPMKTKFVKREGVL